MSGTNVGPPPRTDAELARDLVRRSERLENPDASRAGDWVFSTGNNGELLASNVQGGNIVMATPPDADSDPDAVVPISHDLPYIKMHTENSQAVAANTRTPVEWDTVDDQVSGWGLPPLGVFTDVIVPRSGLYMIHLVVYFPNGVRQRDAMVLIDGVVKAHNTRPSTSASGTGVTNPPSNSSPETTFVGFLGAGQKIQGVGYAAVTATTMGPDSESAVQGIVFTTMSIVCLRELQLGAVTV